MTDQRTTIRTLARYAKSLVDSGEYLKARDIYRRSLAIAPEVLAQREVLQKVYPASAIIERVLFPDITSQSMSADAAKTFAQETLRLIGQASVGRSLAILDSSSICTNIFIAAAEVELKCGNPWCARTLVGLAQLLFVPSKDDAPRISAIDYRCLVECGEIGNIIESLAHNATAIVRNSKTFPVRLEVSQAYLYWGDVRQAQRWHEQARAVLHLGSSPSEMHLFYRLEAMFSLLDEDYFAADQFLRTALRYVHRGTFDACSTRSEIAFVALRCANLLFEDYEGTDRRGVSKILLQTLRLMESAFLVALRPHMPGALITEIRNAVNEDSVKHRLPTFHLRASFWRVTRYRLAAFANYYSGQKVTEFLSGAIPRRNRRWASMTRGGNPVASKFIWTLAGTASDRIPPWMLDLRLAREKRLSRQYADATVFALSAAERLADSASELGLLIDTSNLAKSIYTASREMILALVESGSDSSDEKAQVMHDWGVSWQLTKRRRPESINRFPIGTELYVRVVLCEGRSFVWFSDRYGSVRKEIPDGELIRSLVRGVRRRCSDHKCPKAEWMKWCRLLGKTIFQHDRIDISNRHLVVIADPDMVGLPWSALIIGDGEVTLLQLATISIVPSAQFLRQQTGLRGRKSDEIVIVADPILDDSVYLPIPFASEEVQRIVKATDQRRVKSFLRADANRSNVAAIRGAKVLHFATHKAVTKTGSSAIVLSSEGDHGALLDSQDVRRMHIDAQLIVLNLCESGLGVFSPGEGVADLPRAFLEAGARRVIATLWPIEDAASMKLIEIFYSKLMEKEDANVSEALRRSQLEMSSDPIWSAPCHWASHYLIGDPAPMHVSIP